MSIWIIVLITCGAALACLAGAIAQKPQRARNAWRVLTSGIREGLHGSGVLPFRGRYRSELWVWETLADEDVCEDCLRRAAWRPMDIADWMRLGLPGTPESETCCGEACRCRLVPFTGERLT